MTALCIVLLLFIAALLWAVVAQRREIARLRSERGTFAEAYVTHDELRCEQQRMKGRLRTALHAIEAATRDGKSGTARKVHRMAVEALK